MWEGKSGVNEEQVWSPHFDCGGPLPTSLGINFTSYWAASNTHWIYRDCVYIITVTSCSVKTWPIWHFSTVAKGQEKKKKKSKYEIQIWFILVTKEDSLLPNWEFMAWFRCPDVDFRHAVIYQHLSRKQNTHPIIRQTGISLNRSHVPGLH